VSPGVAMPRADFVHGRRRRRGRGVLRSASDRARASRAKVVPFARHVTLPDEDHHTEKSVLFPKIDRLDGFRAKRANPAFDKKPLGISVAYSGEKMEITPRIANLSRTLMPMRVQNAPRLAATTSPRHPRSP